MQNMKHRKLRTMYITSRHLEKNDVDPLTSVVSQMNYPAPYSQSWAEPLAVPVGVDKMKKCASFPANNRNKPNDPTCKRCWQRPKPLTQGSNPYAPHLKYGLFPRKVSLREPLHRMPMPKKKSPTEEIHVPKMDRIYKDRENTYEYKKGERHYSDHRNVNLYDSDAPLFVVRPIDKRYSRQLSLSEVTHIDINPQKSAPLPLVTSPLGERLRRKNRGNTRY